jgi:hypothetical protein
MNETTIATAESEQVSDKIETEKQFRDAARRYVRLKLKVERKAARLVLRINKLEKQFDDKNAPALAELERLYFLGEKFAESRPDLFARNHDGGPRSVAIGQTQAGFRWEPFKVLAQTDSLDRLKATKWGRKYIRHPKPELDKQSLLKDRETITARRLKSVGISFEQVEVFFIKHPKMATGKKAKKQTQAD